MRAECPRHIPAHQDFNPHIRLLLRVSFKLAAKAGNRYLDLLQAKEEIVARQLTENIYSRRVKPLLVG